MNEPPYDKLGSYFDRSRVSRCVRGQYQSNSWMVTAKINPAIWKTRAFTFSIPQNTPNSKNSIHKKWITTKYPRLFRKTLCQLVQLLPQVACVKHPVRWWHRIQFVQFSSPECISVKTLITAGRTASTAVIDWKNTLIYPFKYYPTFMRWENTLRQQLW
jgi:hypothetical protein